ncbi:MAG: DUF3237 domain-containing protein [Stenotrophobium sp.]
MKTMATTTLTSEYLMTLHTPGAGAPHAVDGSLFIYRGGADGWARGPRINGAIIQPTADWLRVMPNGSLRVDARMTVKTDDGALVHVSYNGVISMTPANFARMSQGDTLTANDMYFMIAPTFQTGHEKYAWLNHLQAVGKVAGIKGGDDGYVTYDVFAVN